MVFHTVGVCVLRKSPPYGVILAHTRLVVNSEKTQKTYDFKGKEFTDTDSLIIELATFWEEGKKEINFKRSSCLSRRPFCLEGEIPTRQGQGSVLY